MRGDLVVGTVRIWQPLPVVSAITHYIKIYPDRYKVIDFKTSYMPLQNLDNGKKGSGRTLTEDEQYDNQEKSLNHTKTVLADLAFCNDFTLFVTFTLNCRACVPRCVNKDCTCNKATCMRYNLDYAIRTQKAWYNNQIKRYGRFKYVQVMELHKDKGHHFHALFEGYAGPLKKWRRDSKDGRQLYNLASNKKGWTTVKRIYDKDGAAKYVRKYIVKDMPVFPGKKRIWTSQGLKRPIVTQNEELRQQIVNDPNQETYIPSDEPVKRPNGTLRENSSNIASITTLLADNKARYEQELGMPRAIKLMTGTSKPKFDVFDPFEIKPEPAE